MADDPRSTSGKTTTILSVVELALADTPEPERAVDIIEFVIERLSARAVPLKVQIAERLRRDRNKTPPPPRKPSRPILPPAPAEPWDSRAPTDRTRAPGLGDLARAETAAKNPGELLRKARADDAEIRDTPLIPDPRREPE